MFVGLAFAAQCSLYCGKVGSDFQREETRSIKTTKSHIQEARVPAFNRYSLDAVDSGQAFVTDGCLRRSGPDNSCSQREKGADTERKTV